MTTGSAAAVMHPSRASVPSAARAVSVERIARGPDCTAFATVIHSPSNLSASHWAQRLRLGHFLRHRRRARQPKRLGKVEVSERRPALHRRRIHLDCVGICHQRQHAGDAASLFRRLIRRTAYRPQRATRRQVVLYIVAETAKLAPRLER
jgi:hypothetical protein